MRNRFLNLYFSLFLALLFFPGITSGFQVIGTLPNGPSFDVLESNGFLFAAQGGEVRVYDVSTSAKVEALSWRDYLSRIYVGGASVRGLYYDSGYLYIASEGRFVIADVTQPNRPVTISTVNSPYSKGSIRDVEVKGDFAYLSISGQGVQIVDIKDKTNPKFVNLVKLKGSNKPWRLSIDGNSLYVVSETDNRFHIYDISKPESPVKIGDFSLNTKTESFSGVAVKGNYAFVSEYHNGLRVIDISDPKSPHQVGDLMKMNANDIKIIGNYAYVSVRYQGFNIIDISNPASPVLVSKAKGIGGYIEGIYPAADGFTYLAGESMGIGIYDTTTISAPRLVTKIMLIGGAVSLVTKDNYLYIGAHNDGIWIVDIKDPANPKEVAFVNNRGRNSDVKIQGDYLYVAGTWSGLNVIDISNPEQPKMVVFDYADSIAYLLPDGNYLYTNKGIVDISTPTKPTYVAHTADMDGHLAKYGENYVLAAAMYRKPGLYIVDVRDKTKPVLVSIYSAGKGFSGVAVNGDTAIALTGNDIVAIDISDVANPKEISKVSFTNIWIGRGMDVDAKNRIAYVSGGASDQVKAVDISNPDQIKVIDKIQLSPNIYYSGVHYYDGLVYVSEKSGLFVLSLKPGVESTSAEPSHPTLSNRETTEGIVTSSNQKITPKKIPMEFAPWMCLVYCVIYLKKKAEKK